MPSPRTRPLKVGIFLPHLEREFAGTTPRWTDILAIAQRAEALGFDSLWIADHFLYPPLPGTSERLGTWECWTMLAALAATTTRIELGSLVCCTSFRNPALLAKMADTVDEISGGRLILGLGAGWNELEFSAFGYPYDHRASRFEEALTIIHGLLREGHVDFAGNYYQARNCELRPRGPRPHGPPIMVGTTAPRLLRVAARYADSVNGWSIDFNNHPIGIPLVRAEVDAACLEIGRDPATLERSAAVQVHFNGAAPHPTGYPGWSAGDPPPLAGAPDELAEIFRAYAREGMAHVQVWTDPANLSGLEALAVVLEILDRD